MDVNFMTMWIIIGVVAVGNFIIRFSFIYWLAGKEVSANVRSILRYIPSTALIALVYPIFFYQQGSIDISFNNHYLIAGTIATIVAFKTKNIFWVLTIGMGALFLLQNISLYS